MSDQGMYQKGINSDSSGVAGTFIASGTIGGSGNYAVDTTTGGAVITVTLPPATIGAGAIVSLFATDAAIAGFAVTVAPDATIPDTINGIATMTTVVNPTQSYISDGVSVWVAFPYAV